MVCANCHSPNFRDYKYCRECGSRLDAPTHVGAATVGEDGAAQPAPPGTGKGERVDQLLEQALEQLQRGDEGQARASAQAALALEPHSAAAHSMLGLVYEQQGMVPEAIQQLEMALQLNPNSSADRNKLAALRGATGKRRAGFILTPLHITVLSAVAAGCLVFGCGLSLLLNSSPSSGTGSTAAVRGSSTPMQSSGLAGPGSRPAVPAAPAPVRPPSPVGGQNVHVLPPPPVLRTPKPVSASTLSPTRSPGLTAPPPGNAPLQRIGLPSPRPQAPVPGGAGLAPAAVGQLVPLSGAPGSASNPPGQPLPPSPMPGAPPLRAAGPPVHPNPAPMPQPAQPVPQRVEPIEPETGFIRVEPAGGTLPRGGPRP